MGDDNGNVCLNESLLLKTLLVLMLCLPAAVCVGWGQSSADMSDIDIELSL